MVLLVSVPAVHARTLKSTLDDQKSLEITVYNNSLGLVKDTRLIDLPKGQGELRFMDVASYIKPVTVHVKSLNAPDAFMVLEQNYEYDLMDSNKLLDKYVGKKIKLIDVNEFQGTRKTVEAELLSNNNGQIYKINNEIHLGHPGYRVLPEIPENLIAKPTLTWLYQNTNNKPHKIEVSYLTNNISWKSDYVVVLDKEDAKAGLNGWVTLDNRSGATYKNAKLKLIAGEVNRANERKLDSRYADVAMEGAVFAKGGMQFQEKAFFEYHIYDLQRKTTIKNNQTKQVSLLEANGVDVTKEYIVRGQNHYFYGHYAGQDLKNPVNVYVKFKNEKENNLGMPLPAGIMRMYKADDDNSLQFIGEDRIEHTPKDEEIKLKLGEAFDVVAERKQTDYKQLGNYAIETEWEITLRNHKDKGVVVNILEPLHGDWQIISNTHSYNKEDAFTVKFPINVAKDEEVKLKYRVRTKR